MAAPAKPSGTGPDEPALQRVGLVADTHGAMDPRLASALSGVSRIIHAGDVGDRHVLEELALLAPVTAVRGNIDDGDLRRDLPVFTAIDVAGVRFVVTHIKDRAFSTQDARRIGADVFVFGHTHVPFALEEEGLLEINPGSASRARSGHPRSIGMVEVGGGTVASWEIVPLDGPPG
jgi:uncharacterized protein